MRELDGLKKNVLMGAAARDASRVLESMQRGGLTRGQRDEEVLLPQELQLQLGAWLGKGKGHRLKSRWAPVAAVAAVA